LRGVKANLESFAAALRPASNSYYAFPPGRIRPKASYRFQNNQIGDVDRISNGKQNRHYICHKTAIAAPVRKYKHERVVGDRSVHGMNREDLRARMRRIEKLVAGLGCEASLWGKCSAPVLAVDRLAYIEAIHNAITSLKLPGSLWHECFEKWRGGRQEFLDNCRPQLDHVAVQAQGRAGFRTFHARPLFFTSSLFS
jgi:hypothetical protein